MSDKIVCGFFGFDYRYSKYGHTGVSITHGKVPKNIIWKYMSRKDVDKVFYVDQHIYTGLRDSETSRNDKYAMLLESRAISPDAVGFVKRNHEQISKEFKYLFTHNKEILDLQDNFVFVPANGHWVHEPEIYDKSKMVSMISSNKRMCKGHLQRIKIVEKFKGDVDLYGRGYNPIATKEEGLKDYMFSIAIENDTYSNYFTEKIMDCFACGTIPIYKGDPEIGKYFNEDGIIRYTKDFDVESLTEKLYYSKMDAIEDNFNRVQELDILEDWIYMRYVGDEISN